MIEADLYGLGPVLRLKAGNDTLGRLLEAK